jgi:hypothetical protein
MILREDGTGCTRQGDKRQQRVRTLSLTMRDRATIASETVQQNWILLRRDHDRKTFRVPNPLHERIVFVTLTTLMLAIAFIGFRPTYYGRRTGDDGPVTDGHDPIAFGARER